MTQPPDDVTHAREARAWRMRSRGWSQLRIADELGITQSGVSRLLARVERRELRRLSKAVERLKVVQSAQLDHVIEESIDAWHRSKTPRKRAASKTEIPGGGGDGHGGDDQGGETRTTEVVERDGEASYLYAAMTALTHQRSLWGLDVAPALQDPVGSIADLTRDLFRRAAEYEQRGDGEGEGQTQAGPAGDPSRAGPADPGGTDEVPPGPGPLQ